MKTRPGLSTAVVIVLALIAGSCGDESSSTAEPSVGGSTSTVPAGDRGWLDGDDLSWRGAAGEGDDARGLVALAPTAEYAAEETSLDSAETADTGGDEARTSIDTESEPIVVDQSPLQAGSIDDGADFDAYVAYRDRITAAGVPVRPLDVDAPTVIAVTGSNGMPVLDAAVTVFVAGSDQQGQTFESGVALRTTADGTTRFLPDAHAELADVPTAGDGPFDVTVTVGDTTATTTFERGDARVEISVDAPGGIDGSVPVDVHFLLDATGSMDDEIDRLRTNMVAIAEQIDALPSDPDVRFGMTVYRDEGDLFVSRTFDLTDDLSSFLDALGDVVADGGGDYPEALDEALADALRLPEWRRDGAVELILLIADAPPQVGRAVDMPYTDSALLALERGVKILPVAASGTDDQAEYVYRELAYVTGGRFVFLSYGVDGSGGTATGEGSDITPDDYDQLPLDQLVVRLVEDEILALTGGVPTPTTTQ